MVTLTSTSVIKAPAGTLLTGNDMLRLAPLFKVKVLELVPVAVLVTRGSFGHTEVVLTDNAPEPFWHIVAPVTVIGGELTATAKVWMPELWHPEAFLTLIVPV